MLRLFLCLAFFLLSVPLHTARAEEAAATTETTAAPAYTTGEADKAAHTMKSRRLPVSLPPKEEEKKQDEPTDPQKPKTADEEIWEKYKKLAAGTPEIETSADGEDHPDATEDGSAAKSETPAAPGSLMSILEEYQDRESKKGKMHSRSMPLPEDREK